MRQRSSSGTPGSRFALLMVLVLVFLVLLVFSIRKRAASQPNHGPPPNQHLQH